MARPNVFSQPTTLYHASEPEGRVFGVGETDPGNAWSDRPGGNPVGGAALSASLKDLIAAQDQIDAMGETQARMAHDLAESAKTREEALAKVADLEQAATTAGKERDEAQAIAQELTGARDGLNAQLTAARQRISALESDVEKGAGENADLRREIASLHKDRDDLTGQVEALTAPPKAAKARVDA